MENYSYKNSIIFIKTEIKLSYYIFDICHQNFISKYILYPNGYKIIQNLDKKFLGLGNIYNFIKNFISEKNFLSKSINFYYIFLKNFISNWI